MTIAVVTEIVLRIVVFVRAHVRRTLENRATAWIGADVAGRRRVVELLMFAGPVHFQQRLQQKLAFFRVDSVLGMVAHISQVKAAFVLFE